LTATGKLIAVTQETIHSIVGIETQLSTAGGTSDARFIAPTGAEVVEIGPCNASAHKIDEHVRIEDVEVLRQIYEGVLERILG
jgi:succinyl-diaminopimelate desuccinylase